jgi:hypothetical protein
MLEDYLKNLHQKLSYIDLITYFLANFKKIRKVDGFISELQPKVFDITDTPEQQIIRSMEESYPGHQSHSFIFQEDDRFSGVVDLDFVNDILANFRAQLFARGFFASSKMNKKYNSVLEFMTNKYGEGNDRLFVYDKTWYDKNHGLVITLRKVKGSPKPSISFTIVDERFVE